MTAAHLTEAARPPSVLAGIAACKAFQLLDLSILIMQNFFKSALAADAYPAWLLHTAEHGHIRLILFCNPAAAGRVSKVNAVPSVQPGLLSKLVLISAHLCIHAVAGYSDPEVPN